MNPEHPDFEDLSAYHDGEAPEWADHVASCARCHHRVVELAGLSSLIATTGPQAQRTGGVPGGPDDAVRRAGGPDDAVRRAVTAVEPERGGGTTAAEAPPEGPRRWWMGASVAAMLVVTVAIGALVASRGDQAPAPTALGPGAGDRATTPAGAAADGNAGTMIVAGDLGEIADRAALVARVRADLDAARSPTAGQDLATMPESSPSPASQGPPAAVSPVEPPPCEAEARRGPGERGEVIYRASGEKDGTAAVVLAFGPPRESDPVTVEVRARSDCRLLLQGAIL